MTRETSTRLVLPNGIELSDPTAPRIPGKHQPGRKRKSARPNLELRAAMKEAGMSPNDIEIATRKSVTGQTVRNALGGTTPWPRNQRAIAAALDRRPRDVFKDY